MALRHIIVSRQRNRENIKMGTYNYKGIDYKVDGCWLIDEHGNKNSSEYHGSVEGAAKALYSLESCKRFGPIVTRILSAIVRRVSGLQNPVGLLEFLDGRLQPFGQSRVIRTQETCRDIVTGLASLDPLGEQILQLIVVQPVAGTNHV